MFEHIKSEIKPDAIFWGGDTISHNVESLTATSTVNIMINTTMQLTQAFPELKNKIFPTIGNHDSYPTDVFSMTAHDKSFKSWSRAWLPFMDDDKNRNTWMQHQYFAKELNNKTRVLSINTNICYVLNWNSFTGINDPGG